MIIKLKTFISLFFLAFIFIQCTSKPNKEVITENTWNGFPLKEGNTINGDILMKTFKGYTLNERLGRQDGPNFKMFILLKENQPQVVFNTKNIDDLTLRDVYFKGNLMEDEYGVKIGMTTENVLQKRPKAIHYTEHHQVFIKEEGSHIIYWMKGEWKGPDKNEYTREDIKGWKVKDIIWE